MDLNDYKCFQKFFPFKKKFSLLSLEQISSHNSYLTPPKSIKHIKKLDFGRPQKLTHNHIQSLTTVCLWCVKLASV